MASNGPTKEDLIKRLNALTSDELAETVDASKNLTIYYHNLHTYALELIESRDKTKPIQLDLF